LAETDGKKTTGLCWEGANRAEEPEYLPNRYDKRFFPRPKETNILFEGARNGYALGIPVCRDAKGFFVEILWTEPGNEA
jgi:hypothetical protein